MVRQRNRIARAIPTTTRPASREVRRAASRDPRPDLSRDEARLLVFEERAQVGEGMSGWTLAWVVVTR
jgi:hypothetical protein